MQNIKQYTNATTFQCLLFKYNYGNMKTRCNTKTHENLNKYERKLKGRSRKNNTKNQAILGTRHNKDIKKYTQHRQLER